MIIKRSNAVCSHRDDIDSARADQLAQGVFVAQRAAIVEHERHLIARTFRQRVAEGRKHDMRRIATGGFDRKPHLRFSRGARSDHEHRNCRNQCISGKSFHPNLLLCFHDDRMRDTFSATENWLQNCSKCQKNCL